MSSMRLQKEERAEQSRTKFERRQREAKGNEHLTGEVHMDWLAREVAAERQTWRQLGGGGWSCYRYALEADWRGCWVVYQHCYGLSTCWRLAGLQKIKTTSPRPRLLVVMVLVVQQGKAGQLARLHGWRLVDRTASSSRPPYTQSSMPAADHLMAFFSLVQPLWLPAHLRVVLSGSSAMRCQCIHIADSTSNGLPLIHCLLCAWQTTFLFFEM